MPKRGRKKSGGKGGSSFGAVLRHSQEADADDFALSVSYFLLFDKSGGGVIVDLSHDALNAFDPAGLRILPYSEGGEQIIDLLLSESPHGEETKKSILFKDLTLTQAYAKLKKLLNDLGFKVVDARKEFKDMMERETGESF